MIKEVEQENNQQNQVVIKSINYLIFVILAGINEVTGIDNIANNSSIHRINSSHSNNFWSYPLQPQHSQISFNAEDYMNNNINININNINLNQDDSGLFGIDDYYNENENNNNYDEIINPLFQQLQQNPGMTIDTLILNLNSVINNEK